MNFIERQTAWYDDQSEKLTDARIEMKVYLINCQKIHFDFKVCGEQFLKAIAKIGRTSKEAGEACRIFANSTKRN